MAKVIHVHIYSRPRGMVKDFYFSSIAAIFTTLTKEDVGATLTYLQHAGLSRNGSIVTKKAIIKQATLIAKPAKRNGATS